MQWLIDIVATRVVAEIGIPPTFIDRGDPAAADFDQTGLTYDNAWHDLDLSGIVPANAVAVAFLVVNKVNAIGTGTWIRQKGNANDFNLYLQIHQVANTFLVTDGVCPIGSDGLLEYKFSPIPYTGTQITIKGWWL